MTVHILNDILELNKVFFPQENCREVISVTDLRLRGVRQTARSVFASKFCGKHRGKKIIATWHVDSIRALSKRCRWQLRNTA